jgi:hypothetical protein
MGGVVQTDQNEIALFRQKIMQKSVGKLIRSMGTFFICVDILLVCILLGILVNGDNTTCSVLVFVFNCSFKKGSEN